MSFQAREQEETNMREMVRTHLERKVQEVVDKALPEVIYGLDKYGSFIFKDGQVYFFDEGVNCPACGKLREIKVKILVK